MDPRLLQHYNLELQHLREMGAEFAQQFPKIAARLGMNGLEVADPVRRAAARGLRFLAARVQLKLDAEFPRFTQALLEIVYPHYLAPTPSMARRAVAAGSEGAELATGSSDRPARQHDARPAGRRRADGVRVPHAHDVTLWPIEIVVGELLLVRPGSAAERAADRTAHQGRRAHPAEDDGGGASSRRLPLDRSVVLPRRRATRSRTSCYELCLGSAIGVAGAARRRRDPLASVPAGGRVSAPVGFDDDEALLPVTLRSFQGYRLLQEYFAFPQRYRFFELTGLRAGRFAARGGDEIELVAAVRPRRAGARERRRRVELRAVLHAGRSICSRSGPTGSSVDDNTYEYHVVADRTRPMDFEVYEVTEVVGHGGGADSEQPFLPLYAAYATDAEHEQSAYFTTRREPRLPSSTQKRRGPRRATSAPRSSVAGRSGRGAVSRRPAAAVGSGRCARIATCRCRCRSGVGKTDFTLDVAAPVKSIRVVSGPSRPRRAAGGRRGRVARDQPPVAELPVAGELDAAARAPRRCAICSSSYAPAPTSSAQEADRRRARDGGQAGGAAAADARTARLRPRPRDHADGRRDGVRRRQRLPARRGARTFFTRYVSINSFTETVLRSESRGEVSRWVPQWGARPTL